MTEKEKMLAGKLYVAFDEELKKDSKRARKLVRLFNQTTEEQLEDRTELLKELFESVGKNIYIEPTFRCDYGCHISIGDNFFANYDCIILDVCKVTIGNNVFFGPRVCLCTATHPIDAEVRNTGLEYGKPIYIGDNVWIGMNTIVNPGVEIGNNSIIGAGSVVTKNIPNDVIAVGNPCRILRKITEEDKTYWKKVKEEYEK